MVQDIWLAVRVEAAATLALMSFWGWYCYYRTKVVADCFCQKMDDKLVLLWYKVLPSAIISNFATNY
jgi:hypothetical protein